MRRTALFFLLSLLTTVTTVRAQQLSLADCLTMAETGSAATSARLAVRAAQLQKQETTALWFPTIKAQAIGFHALDPLVQIGLGDVLGSSDAANDLRFYLETEAALNGIPTTYTALSNGYTAGLTLTQPLYAGGRIATAEKLASLGIEAASLQADMTRRDERLTVEKKYWLVVSLKDKQRALEQGLQLIDTVLRDVRSACNAGLALPTDLMQVELRRDELVSDSLQLASGIRLASSDLRREIGLYDTDGQELVLTDSLSALPSPDEVMGVTDVVCDEQQLLDVNVRAKQMEKRLALGEALPQVAVGATYGYGRLLDDARASGLAFVTVSVPLTDWGKTSRKLARLDFEVQRAEVERHDLNAQLALRTAQAEEELRCTWQQMAVAGHSVEVLQSLLAQTRANHAAGTATTTELLQAEVTLRTALVTLTDRRVDYSNALSRYLALTR